MTNAEIMKSISTSDFLSGGALTAKQQERFVMLIRKYAMFLDKVRVVRMTQPNQLIDKLHLGEPITEAATEDADTGNTSNLKFNSVALTAQKVRAAWNITTESLQANIEQNDFEDRVMEAMTERMAHDMEDLAFRGDNSIAGTSPVERLRKTLDGWIIQSEDAHVFDAGGATLTKELYHEIKRVMPKQFRKDPGLRWIMSDTLADDWRKQLSDRGTDLGDRAIEGASARPLSIPIEEVPVIPDDLPVSVGFATPGKAVGSTEFSPYVLTATNNVLRIGVDGNADFNATLPTGTLLGSQVAKAINDALVADGGHGAAYANVARSDAEGKLVLVSPTTGAASEIAISDGGAPGNDAAPTLGLTAGTTTGAAAGSNSTDEGTVFWLTNPRNFIWAILDGTRTFAKFNERFDRIETTVFNQLDVKVENFDSMVYVKNVRLNPLSTGLI